MIPSFSRDGRRAAGGPTARDPMPRNFLSDQAVQEIPQVAKNAGDRGAAVRVVVDEVVLGCGTPQGTTGNNIGRVAALKAGCPITTTGVTVSRHCSSGLNAIATAAGRIIVDGEAALKMFRAEINAYGS